VALPNVYRGLQSVSAGNVVQANTATPTATVTVVDVGGNPATSAALPIATTTAATNVLTGAAFATPVQFTIASSAANGTTSSSVATTNLTVQVIGGSLDAAFQSQPFSQVDFYKVNSNGELALVASVTNPAVTDNPLTNVHTYTYQLLGTALTAGTGGGATSAATNTFYAVGRTAAGDAVISNSVVQSNP
jgi:hypothetical protein